MGSSNSNLVCNVSHATTMLIFNKKDEEMNKLIQERMDLIDQELRELGTYMDTDELYELAVMELKKENNNE